MRIRSLALALVLCFGTTALVEAANQPKPYKAKPYKPKKYKPKKYKMKGTNAKRFKQSNASKVKPRKAQ
jgi:hypothetical protein